MKRIYKRFTKSIALFWVFTLLFQVCFPVISFAITNGPSQPETQGFQPAGTSNMVDLFTGDFQYSIPLFDLEGYPVNLSYQANPGMEDEASWVGLGWTLSPGSVDRNLRGLPDDFRGDVMKRDMNMSDNITYGVNGGFNLKVIGIKKPSGKFSAGIFRNNKKGPGFEFGVSPTFSISKNTSNKTRSLKAGLDLSYNSQGGFDIGGSIGIEKDATVQSKNEYDLSLSGGINSREGVKNLNFGIDVKATGGAKPQDVAKLNGGLTFGVPTYTPVPDLTFKTRSVTLNVGFGGEVAPAFPHSSIGGFYTNQYLAEKHMSQGAYGYLHSQGAVENDDNLMDFNKEVLAVPYSDRMKKLPMAYGTYDLFSAKAQGMGAQFRAFRGDVGVFRDAASHNGSIGFNVGIELGAGNIADVSGSVNVPFSSMDGGDWKSNNNFRNRAAFKDRDGSTLYEPTAFKDAGEMIPRNNDQFYQNVGNEDAAYVQLLQQAMITTATNRLVAEKNQQLVGLVSNSLAGVLHKKDRERRNAVFSYLNGYEAGRFGLDKKIESYTNDNAVCGSPVISTSRTGNRGHHISEITVTQPGGTRYVFGLPVYNTLQKEVSFNINKTEGALTDALAIYDEGVENSTGNPSGRDKFYESRETPAYATSYLITGYLSPDYNDLTGNGISDDDAGTAIKFKYTKINGYKWRSPATDNQNLTKARYNPGLNSDTQDDKASYVYGERELYYVHSMESKNYVARYFIGPRNDGLGILENSKRDVNGPRLQQLNRIEIYAKSELATNSNPVPIKTVHFTYTNQLCPGVPNNLLGSGKLTLASIHFTYGNSNRGARNIYQFTYNIPSDPNYNTANTDRWGVYKKQLAGYPANTVFPFTYQPDPEHPGLATEADLDESASAWNLTSITLPTGAVINIDYESDTYAYVMDKRAGQYIFISGFSDDGNDQNKEPELYDNIAQPHDYIHLDLPVAVSDAAEFRKLYMEDVEHLYFNCRIKLKNGNESSWENITGYADFDLNSIIINSNGLPKSNKVAIKLLRVDGDRGSQLNPIVKAALTTLRSQLPDLAYGLAAPPNLGNDQNAATLIRSLFPVVQDIGDLIAGFDRIRVLSNDAKDIKVSNSQGNTSWVRLANPTFNKFGGGSRVKSVAINDMWATMAPGHQSASYSTTYDYTMPSPLGGEARVSSGVASYEPMLGGEENLWRNPLTYNDRRVFLGPKTISYQETPVGEALFPGPSVGYSEVRVTSTPVNPPQGANSRTGTGYTINKFYTAKDFPTRVDYTALHYTKYKPNPILRLFKFFSRSNMTMSQGFKVEVNDMHGKPKSEEIYNEAGSMISSTEYRYKTDANGNLDNVVRMITPQGDITEGTLGVDMDIWEEMSQEKSSTSGLGASFGVDAGVWGIFPAIFPHMIPIIHNDASTLRTSVTTKFIKRFGIIDKIIKTENGASLASNNLVFDSETGEPLLVETESEYENEPTYQFKYPAHWAYDGMGQAYKNQDAFLENVPVSTSGEITDPNFSKLLNAGDEVIVYRKPPFNIPKLNTYHVTKVTNGGVHTYLIDRFGALLSFTSPSLISLKVKRTARRNMATASIGSFQSLVNPAPETADRLEVGTETKVLQSNAVTFNDHWRIPLVYKRTSCNDQASLEDAMKILCELTDSDDKWYTSESAGANLCSILETGDPTLTLNGIACSQLPFFAMQPEPAYGFLKEYVVNVGDCQISMRHPLGKKFNPTLLTCTNPCGPQPCDPPTNLNFTYEGGGTVITWDPVPGAVQYVVRWRESPDGQWYEEPPINWWQIFTFYGNQSCKIYDIQVKTICAENQSVWSDILTFEPRPGEGCGIPQNLEVFSDPCGAKVEWSAVPDAIEYVVSWRSLPNGNWNSQIVLAPDTYAYLSGLSGEYDIHVRAVCETGSSCYTDIMYFTVGCNAPAPKQEGPVNGQQSALSSSVPGGITIYNPGDCAEMIVEIECLTCNTYPCNAFVGPLESTEIFNPYFWGVLGNWRQENTYAFDNKQTRDYSSPGLNQQGYYSTFNPYWIWDNTGNNTYVFKADASVPNKDNWIRANSVTKYDKAGNPVEEMDALGKFESALFGFKNAMPVARSSNARFTEIGYEGFDSNFEIYPSCSEELCQQNHFEYIALPYENAYISSEKAHTGKASMKFDLPGAIAVFGGGKPANENGVLFPEDLGTGQYRFGNSLMGRFSPVPLTGTKRFVVSAWVYCDLFNCDDNIRNNPPNILTIGFIPGQSIGVAPSGPIIDGWRKIERVIELNSGMTHVSFTFGKPGTFGNTPMYIDDIRVHPFDGSMQSFAYDRSSLRLMATLDERNYATFYEYDDAGILVRTKRETEKGIITVNENRSYLRPNN